MTSAVAVCNLALDELPHRVITSLEENVLAAEVCRRQLPIVLGEIMESNEWSFALKRLALTAITNDRADQYAYAYQVPDDLAMPLRILPAVADVTAPYLLAGQRLASSAGIVDLDAIGFDFEGSTLWTNEPAARLEYVVNDPVYTAMSKRFLRILALYLAVRICMPIKQDAARKNELHSEYELYRQRTTAADLNRNPTQNTYGENFIPSTLMGHVEAPE